MRRELHISTFENFCKENNGIAMGDGITKIFLNADSWLDDVGELEAFLDYVAGRGFGDTFVQGIR